MNSRLDPIEDFGEERIGELQYKYEAITGNFILIRTQKLWKGLKDMK